MRFLKSYKLFESLSEDVISDVKNMLLDLNDRGFTTSVERITTDKHKKIIYEVLVEYAEYDTTQQQREWIGWRKPILYKKIKPDIERISSYSEQNGFETRVFIDSMEVGGGLSGVRDTFYFHQFRMLLSIDNIKESSSYDDIELKNYLKDFSLEIEDEGFTYLINRSAIANRQVYDNRKYDLTFCILYLSRGSNGRDINTPFNPEKLFKFVTSISEHSKSIGYIPYIFISRSDRIFNHFEVDLDDFLKTNHHVNLVQIGFKKNQYKQLL